MELVDVCIQEPEMTAISPSDSNVDSVLQQGLVVQNLINKEQSFRARLQAAVESATVRLRPGGRQEYRVTSTPCYPREEAWTMAGGEGEVEAPYMKFSFDTFCSTGSEGNLSLSVKDDAELSERTTMRDEMITEEAIRAIDKRVDSNEPSITLFTNLAPEERNQYVTTIDNILHANNLQTVSAKVVREAMSIQLDKDFSSQEPAMNQLILERFARMSTTTTPKSVDDAISKYAELAHHSFSSSKELAGDEPGFNFFGPSIHKESIDQKGSLKQGIPVGQIPQLQNPCVSLANTTVNLTEALKSPGEMPATQSTFEANANTNWEEKALLLSQVSQLQSDLEGYEKRIVEMQMEMEAKLTASYLKTEEEQNRHLMAHTNATRASQARLVEADHAFATMYIEKLDLEKTIEDLRAQFKEHDDSLVHGFESLMETIQSEHAEEVAKLKARIRKLNTRKFESDLSAERVLIEGSEEE